MSREFKDSNVDDRELEALENDMKSHLQTYQVKKPSADETAALIERLQHEEESVNEIKPFEQRNSRLTLLAHVRMQFGMTRWYMWVVSFAIIAMLTLITEPSDRLTHYFANPMTLFLPLLVAVGVIYTLKTWNREMRMVETATPFPPVLLLFSKLFVLLSIQFIFAVGGSIYLWITLEQFYIVTFVLSWLAPFMFVTGLFMVFVAWKGTVAGVIAASVVSLLFMVRSQGVLNDLAVYSSAGYHTLLTAFLLAGLAMLAGSCLKGRRDYDSDVTKIPQTG